MDRLLDGSGYTREWENFFFFSFFIIIIPSIFPYDGLPCQHQYQYPMINRTDIRVSFTPFIKVREK